MQTLSLDFEKNKTTLDALLGVGRCFDLVSRDLVIASRRARLWFVDGYCDDGALERMTAFWLALGDISAVETAQQFCDRYVTFGEVNVERIADNILTGVFLGKTLLLIEGFDEAVLIDAKGFPMRSVEEPESGRVLRGAHDGFIEILTINAALLRRRIRDTRLVMEGVKISPSSRADAAICYIEGKADEKLVDELRTRLAKIDANSISMGQESIAESLMRGQWYNPFPRVRYTERPDTASASLLEGSILLLIDNTASAMILPTRLFDFVEEANDFYFPPLVGTYLRLIRASVFILTVFLAPVWYMLVREPAPQDAWYAFLAIEEPNGVPILVQLLLLEFTIDLIKLASLNTPDVYGSSFSMLGALILGDFAVRSNWLVPEVLAYMAFIAIANFAQPSYELGYSLKLTRVCLVLLCAVLGWAGLAAGTLLLLILLVRTRPILGKHYLYPLIPFNPKKFLALLTRHPISRKNT